MMLYPSEWKNDSKSQEEKYYLNVSYGSILGFYERNTMQDFNARSEKNIRLVDNRLVRIFKAVRDTHYSTGDVFACVVSGFRTTEEQQAMVASGASRTMNSRHLFGKAIDIMLFDKNGQIIGSHSMYRELAHFMIEEAKSRFLCIEWGGVIYGKKFVDADHFQIPPHDDNFEYDNPLGAAMFYHANESLYGFV